jgi:metallo-beta-lactamase class B
MKALLASAAAAALFVAACAMPAPAQQATPSPQATPTQRERWNIPTDPFKIAGNIYYVGTGGLAAYLFTGANGHVLLDGALPESVPEIEANIRQLGFQLSDIKIIVNSHAHYDHSGGLAQLKADTGAQLVAMEGDVSALEGGFYLGSESTAAMGAPPVKVDRVIHDGDTVELPGIRLVAHLTPGHTRGCTSWGETVSEGGRSLEALVFCSATVAANRITPPLQYAGIVEDYRRTFTWAKTARVDIFLAPHPEFYDMAGKRARMRAGGPNPFVNPAEFGPFIARQEADFERTLAERTAAAARPAAR